MISSQKSAKREFYSFKVTFESVTADSSLYDQMNSKDQQIFGYPVFKRRSFPYQGLVETLSTQ